MLRALTLIACLAVAAACGGSAYGGGASVSPDLGDLVGMQARSLDTEMSSQGYSNTGGYKEGDTSYTTWWNAAKSHCVSVATRDGRVDDVETIADGNCQ